ncbi:cysteine-rich receptor-like protein kinase 17 [Raphanus sativus]|nr:cysteine-rich receptor-like protein kinase 17 [Raphanus sativus]
MGREAPLYCGLVAFSGGSLYNFSGAFDNINGQHPPSLPPPKSPSVANLTNIAKKGKLCYVQEEERNHDMQLPTESVQFDFKTIEAATSNFSEANKLGAGGFGEVTTRNLVRLLGFSLQGEEKLLVYEFVPTSLDYFLVDGLVNNLVTYVWRLWEDKSLPDLIDPCIKEDCNIDEVVIHTYWTVVRSRKSCRSSNNVNNSPNAHNQLYFSACTSATGIFFRNRSGTTSSSQGLEPNQSSNKSFTCSVDEATITEVNPR